MRKTAKQVMSKMMPVLNGRIVGSSTPYFTKPVEQVGEVTGKGKDKRRKARYFAASQKSVSLSNLIMGMV